MRSCHPQFEHIPANKTLIVKYIYSNEIRQNITDNAENISKNAEKNRCIGLTRDVTNIRFGIRYSGYSAIFCYSGLFGIR